MLEVAVVWGPHEKRERPKVLVVLRPGATATADEVITHVRGQIAPVRRAEDSRDRFAYGGVETVGAEISVRGPKYVIKKGKTPPAIR